MNSRYARSAQFQEKAGHVDWEKNNKEIIEPSVEGNQTAGQTRLVGQEQGRQDRRQDRQTGSTGEKGGGQSRQGRQGFEPRGGAFEDKGPTFEIRPCAGVDEIVSKSVGQGQGCIGAENSKPGPRVRRRGGNSRLAAERT